MFARVIFHLLPLVPLAFGYQWLAVAMILLVAVSYIKVKKIEQQIKDLSARSKDHVEIEGLRNTRNFWLGLTFLSDKEGKNKS